VTGNTTHRFSRTSVLSVERVEAPEVVTSAEFDDQLADVFQRTRLRGGLLERLVGIRARRWWAEGETFTDGAARAGEAAIAASGLGVGDIDLMINTSVSRRWLEPSTSVVVHDQIGLPPSCQNFDITNACLGFLNGIEVAGAMVESGMIDHALIVNGEDSRHLQQTTIARLLAEETTSKDVMAEFAALTLGSGAVAVVVGRTDDHPDAHRVVASASRAGTEHNGLCYGDNEQMTTDLKGLLDAGLELSTALWAEATQEFDWGQGMDRYFIHQVSQVHTESICQRLDIDPTLVPRTFPEFGNIGPASVAYTLAGEQQALERGDRVLMMGIGSGLNATCMELEW
jgi:3-oxoacyl-[acyl-carrier-protein] synthase-3